MKREAVTCGPVERAAQHLPVAADAIGGRSRARREGVDPQPELPLAAEAPADVHAAAKAALAVADPISDGHIACAGALGHEIDDARRRRDAIVQRGRPFEQFHPLLVFQWHRRKVDDRQAAVQPVIGLGIDRDAPRQEGIAVERAGCLLRHAGCVAQRIVQPQRPLIVQKRAVHDVDRRGRVEHAAVAEGADLNGVDAIAGRRSRDHDLLVERAFSLGRLLFRCGRCSAAGRCGSEHDGEHRDPFLLYCHAASAFATAYQ